MEQPKIYNEIDMEGDIPAEDMSGFGLETDFRPMKTITATMENRGGYDTLDIKKNWSHTNQDYSNINPVDMECSCCDDDDDFLVNNFETPTSTIPQKELDTSIYYGETADFSDDDIPEIQKAPKTTIRGDMFDEYSDDVPYDDTEELPVHELVDEEMLSEKKRSTISTGDSKKLTLVITSFFKKSISFFVSSPLFVQLLYN